MGFSSAFNVFVLLAVAVRAALIGAGTRTPMFLSWRTTFCPDE
jgi:hypothetical protein